MKSILIFSFCFLSTVMGAWAAPANQEVSRDVTVERDYNPTIRQVSKHVLTPQKEDLKPTPLSVTYNTWSQPQDVTLQPNVPKAVNASVARNYPYKKGVAKVGFGFYLQTLAEFYYPLLQGDTYLLDVNAKHLSNWSKIPLSDGTEPRGMSNFTDIALNYEHQFTDMRLAVKAGYAYTGYDYYGLSTEPVSPFYKDTVGNNSVVEVAAKLFSTNTKESLQYHVGLEYLYFGRNFDISMHEVGVHADVSGEVGNDGRLGGVVQLDVHTTAMPSASSVSSVPEPVEGPEEIHTHTAAILTLTPYYSFGRDDWGVKIGANLFAHIAAGEKQWPVSGSANIDAHVGIVPELFYLYAGIGGSYQSNDYYSIVKENKYITPNLTVNPCYTPFNVDLGLKVRIMKGLLFDVNFNYDLILNQYYFVNHVHQVLNESTQVMEAAYYTNTFDVVYEPTTHHVGVGAGLHFDYVPGLDASAYVQYNLWGVTQQAHAWQKPAWEVGVKGTYHFLEKWEVGASYTFLGGRMALVQEQAVAMNHVHDVNVWASYQALDWLNVFIEGKNLANNYSDTYYGYRSFGINAMVGATFRF